MPVQNTYPDAKIIITSTPTEGQVATKNDEQSALEFWQVADNADDVLCPTWSLMEQGTFHHWAWQCPHCNSYFIPRRAILIYDDKKSFNAIRETAAIACPHCGGLITDKHKNEMNKTGRFVAKGQTINKDGVVEGKPQAGNTVSFWVSGLCSPWRTFGERAEKLEKALRSGEPGRIQAVVNTDFGELYNIQGTGVDISVVLLLKAGYKRGDIPDDVAALSMGVDVQINRIVYVIRGWAANRSYLIEHGEIYGDLNQLQVWGQLKAMVDKEL